MGKKKYRYICDIGGEELERVGQRCGGCPGDTDGQAGGGFERPELDVGVPAHGRGVELDGLPTQMML